MRLDWLLAIGDAVAEVEQEQQGGGRSPGMTSIDLPDGRREVRINYRELEAEQ